jgi:hypothetical protein
MLTAHKSGVVDTVMLGFSAIRCEGSAVAVTVAVVDFGVDGMLRFATLAQEVIDAVD